MKKLFNSFSVLIHHQWLGAISLILLFCIVMPLPMHAGQGYDYINDKSNYRAYASGNSMITFSLPVWALGGWNYHVTENSQGSSYITYQRLMGDTTEHVIAHFRADPGEPNDVDSELGSVDVQLMDNAGILVVTSMLNGTEYRIDKPGWVRRLGVRQYDDTNCKRATLLEMDWYMPDILDSVPIKITFHIHTERCKGGHFSENWTQTITGFSGGQMLSPILMSPYMYMVNDKGLAGYGYAGIPYALFYKPISYSTSLDNTEKPATSQAGNLFVMTNDTVQTNFYANFKVYRDESKGLISTQKSTNVKIPPYHRIYDLNVIEEKDSTDTYTGNSVISWRIKNPSLRDIVANDYFEVQRALKADFSDAEQLTLQPLKRNESGEYKYVDQSRETWTGHAQVRQDTIASYLTVRDSTFIVKDYSGRTLAEVDASLVCKSRVLPAVSVYYRIRRASSSVWGWDSDFVKTKKLSKTNYLAPLADVQPDYTKDADYDNNHKVNFKIKIDNRLVDSIKLDSSKSELKYKIKRAVRQAGFNVKFNFSDSTFTTYDTRSLTEVRILDEENRVLNDWHNVPYQSELVSCNHWVEIRCKNPSLKGYDKIYRFEVKGDTKVDVTVKYYYSALNWLVYVDDSEFEKEVTERAHTIKDSLFRRMVKEDEFTVGRCMWDRTAQLKLIRTVKETGAKLEIIIPQDSIRRLADGSWEAGYFDIADQACTTYEYSVVIDDSKADLRFQHPAQQKQAKVLTGPSLYFDEGADIRTFEVSKGDARGNLKSGVSLNWTPTNSSVDIYLLLRKPINSDNAPDTIYAGLETSYFDVTAKPGVKYDYTIVSAFDCHGKRTINHKTDTGWRSEFGEISGIIEMPDNCGMNGIKVQLSGDTLPSRTVYTNSIGAYKFDSIPYSASSGTNYTVMPTHSSAIFGFNHGSSSSATVKLEPDNAVVTGINFQNTTVVRISGRVLYNNTTVPVPGVMFILNQDTIRRGNGYMTTNNDGTFEMTITKGANYTLRVFKPGHTFANDGKLFVETGKEEFALTKSLDGVRFYDNTRVRLVGRVAGGNNQRDLKRAFGLGTNNLGDNLQLVMQLEGDNTAHMVHDPYDLSRDTVIQVLDHQLTDESGNTRKVGTTRTLIEKHRITITPDNKTGEFAVDLFPAKFKVIQVTAQGYATLFRSGQGSEIVDLTYAPMTHITDTLSGETVQYNAVYDRIYHTPIQIELTPKIYGMEQAGYGEPEMEVSSFDEESEEKVKLWRQNPDGTVTYTLGYPVFYSERKYQFTAKAYEDYYYNNERSNTRDRVPWRGGVVRVFNGLSSNVEELEFELNNEGLCNNVWLMCNHVDVEASGEGALRTVSASLTTEGNVVKTDVFHGFVTGFKVVENDLRSTATDLILLDVIRDPGGSGSSAYLESGSTYSFSYNKSYDFQVGVALTPKYGLDVSTDVGVIFPAGPSLAYTGSHYETSRLSALTIPISYGQRGSTAQNFTFTTTRRIETSNSPAPSGVGSPADIFYGVTAGTLTGKAKTIAVINDTMYQQRQPAINSGAMLVLAQGQDEEGKPFYLVTGEKVILGSSMVYDFTYTQKYVMESLIPQLARERQNLLMYFHNEEEAKQAANTLQKPVYWYSDSLAYLRDSLPIDSYRMVIPDGSKVYTDEVAALDRLIKQWLYLLIYNEQEKVNARTTGYKVGTYALSDKTSTGQTLSYSSNTSLTTLPVEAYFANVGAQAGKNFADGIMNVVQYLKSFWSDKNIPFGKGATELLKGFFTQDDKLKNKDEIGTITNVSKFDFSYEPINSVNLDANLTKGVTLNKEIGFTLVPDDRGDITVSVYRTAYDSIWGSQVQPVISQVGESMNPELEYRSLVFLTESGSSFCPHEEEERTKFYQPGTLIHNATRKVAYPELSVDIYEKTNVAPDKRATFMIVLKNGGNTDAGAAEEGLGFNFFLDPGSNPNGAKAYIDGVPVASSPYFWIIPSQPIVKTLEIERGMVDDYDLAFVLALADCPTTTASIKLKVHFLPISSDVNISMPRQNWVMNTLSPHDSMGYYLPITIEGFDIYHKNFDHIEFQYKLVTQSEDDWVNYCSFYAEDSIYQKATGNKAMIEDGVIRPFRFYGQKDPSEHRYDLRAVSFCRYGSGFVTKSSPIISGTKDTRPPRVFGEPEPANGILGVGDYMQLKFNENIAGNYLDEDNNFEVLGYTNASGISATNSLHFSTNENALAATKVLRVLPKKAFTLDMMVRLDKPYGQSVFFSYGKEESKLEFGLDNDSCLYVNVGSNPAIRSSRLTTPLTEFTRIAVVVNNQAEDSVFVRFYIGNQDITNPKTKGVVYKEFSSLRASYLVFGSSMNGDMLETRVWSKPLPPVEISTTNRKYLTGYERELLAYYRMNEGVGSTLTDLANGATLYLNGCTWNVRNGISLAVNPEQRVRIDGNVIARGKNFDGSYAFWFRPDYTTDSATLFAALGADNEHGLAITYNQKVVSIRIDSVNWPGTNTYAFGEWHQVVLSINRTFNHAALFVDGDLIVSLPADVIPDIAGAMYLGGGWKGLIDDFTAWEQALPKSFIHLAGRSAIEGDEMGLMAYLPFEQQILNASGVLENVFSIYDQRLIRLPDGSYKTTGIRMVQDDPATLAHQPVNAPTISLGKLTKLKFDWSFHNEELIVNILNQPDEINKQSMFITVRDVEDLNGNPMPSPAMWTAFVDRNNLKWSERSIDIASIYGDHESNTFLRY